MAPPTTARSLLRSALRLDAGLSGAMGLALVLAAAVLAGPLRLPEPLLRNAGLLLLPCAAAIAYVGTRPVLARGAVTVIVALNTVWGLASILLLVGSSVSPTAFGTAFIILQALVVFAFAGAEWIGLRRVTRPTATVSRSAVGYPST